MIYSMTAFARRELRGDFGLLVCEIRSVNHRYLEPNFRLADAVRELEMPLREQLRKQLPRKVMYGLNTKQLKATYLIFILTKC